MDSRNDHVAIDAVATRAEREMNLATTPLGDRVRSMVVTIQDDSNPGNAPLNPAVQPLVERLLSSIPRREPERISGDLEAAAARIQKLERRLQTVRDWYDLEYPAEDGHDQVYPWDEYAR